MDVILFSTIAYLYYNRNPKMSFMNLNLLYQIYLLGIFYYDPLDSVISKPLL